MLQNASLKLQKDIAHRTVEGVVVSSYQEWKRTASQRTNNLNPAIKTT